MINTAKAINATEMRAEQIHKLQMLTFPVVFLQESVRSFTSPESFSRYLDSSSPLGLAANLLTGRRRRGNASAASNSSTVDNSSRDGVVPFKFIFFFSTTQKSKFP